MDKCRADPTRRPSKRVHFINSLGEDLFFCFVSVVFFKKTNRKEEKQKKEKRNTSLKRERKY